MDSQGIEVAVTPLQLATILEQESLEESSCAANRFWGAAELVGGAIELIGGTALLLTPEPTAVTKVAGGILAVHGLDTSSAALMQVVSCQTRTTLTSKAVAAGAKALGADPNTAADVALAVEIAVPLIAGLAGTARVIAIRRGTIKLMEHEGPQAGHTIAESIRS